MYQVGVLSVGGNSATWRAQYKPFIQALRDLNYVEGRNLVIKPAFGDGKAERLTALVTELVRAKVDVIVSSGSRDTTTAMRATSTIPIVMWLVVDPACQYGWQPQGTLPPAPELGLTQEVTPDAFDGSYHPAYAQRIHVDDAVALASALAVQDLPDHDLGSPAATSVYWAERDGPVSNPMAELGWT